MIWVENSEANVKEEKLDLGLTDGITDSMDMSLSKLRKLVKPGVLQSMRLQRVGHN